MSYTKQNFIKGQILKADHLNAMETGIEANDLAIAELSDELKGNGPHQMLVTGADGSTKWEYRTHWADSNLDVVLPEVTIDKKIAYLNDYASYTRNLQQDHTYHVVCDGAEYQCSPVWNDILYSYTIGNASLASLGSDTGEPFFINAHNNTQMTIIYFNSEGQHTIAIDEGMIDTVNPLDPKYMPKDYINGLIDSNEKITALTEEIVRLDGDLGIVKGDTSLVNIKTFGAVGDGITDDTDAIAEAIAACQYGGSVFVPEGTYIVSDIALKSDMRIYGIGDASIIKFADGVTAINNSCIRADNVQNVRIEKLQLDGNSANNSMQVYQGDGGFDCIHVGGSSNVVIDSVNGHHAGYHGIIITESDNITVQNCIFHHNGFRPIHGLKNVTTIKILNNECYSNGQGFEGEPNRFDGIFFFNASRDILIRGNYVHDVYNVGAIVIGGATDPSGTFGPSSNVRIEDNTIITWPQLPTNLNTPGIYIIGDDVSDIRITGNTIRNSYNGIHLHNAKSGAKNSGIFIHNNLIENGQQYAIRLNHGSADGAYEDIVVTENSLINYGDNIGVECNNTKKVYIARNVFSGKTGGNSFAGIWGMGATEVIAESNFFVPRTGTLSHAVKFDNTSKDCYFINNYVHTGQVTNDSVGGITERNLPSAD